MTVLNPTGGVLRIYFHFIDVAIFEGRRGRVRRGAIVTPHPTLCIPLTLISLLGCSLQAMRLADRAQVLVLSRSFLRRVRGCPAYGITCNNDLVVTQSDLEWIHCQFRRRQW